MSLRFLLWPLSLAPALLLAASLDLGDLGDFDDDVMRAMDDAFKELEPVIGASNAGTANADLDVLTEGYEWTAAWFRTKGNVQDALDINAAGLVLIADIRKTVAAGDFETAAKNARLLQKNCKACHDVYKPLTK